MNLRQRRTLFVYEASRLAAIAAKAPIIPPPFAERDAVFQAQFSDVVDRQCGERRSSSPGELHGGWVESYVHMGWTYGERYDLERKTHPDMVPYAALGQLERDKDAVFIAICEIARLYIREDER